MARAALSALSSIGIVRPFAARDGAGQGGEEAAAAAAGVAHGGHFVLGGSGVFARDAPKCVASSLPCVQLLSGATFCSADCEARGSCGKSRL